MLLCEPARSPPQMASAQDWKSVSFTAEEMGEMEAIFKTFDKDGNGCVTTEELGEVFKSLGEDVPGYKLRDMISEVDTDNSKTIEFNEFIDMMRRVRVSGSKNASSLYKVVKKVEKTIKLGGTSAASAADTTHAYSEEETVAFADWINYSLSDDADCKKHLPISTERQGVALFDAVKDGILLSKLINCSVPDTVDVRAINRGKLNAFTIGENQTLALNSAAAIGCNVVNIGPEDLINGTPHLVLGLLWQIIRIGLFAGINLQSCPGLSRLLEAGETLADLLALPPDVLLLRWVNFHLKEAGTSKRIKNFSGDIADSEAYIYLLKQISPADNKLDTKALGVHDPLERAEAMLQNAERINCRKFVRATDVVKGNAKLNLAFVAHLFNTYPAMEVSEGFAALSEFELGTMDETREERTFRNWMNSLGVRPFVNNLYVDLTDGMVLLQLFDAVQPGIVNWDKVNKPPYKQFGSNLKKIENLNYAIELGHQLKFSLVGIEGKDIFDGVRTLTLAVIWQLMRAYTLSILQRLSGESKRVTDAEIVEWVNKTLKEHGKSASITSFQDSCISTSLPVLHLIDSIKEKSVNYDIVTPGETPEDAMSNAKYAISMARKIGAGVYALPEDLVEVKPKMVLTVFACLMARAYGVKGSSA